MSSSSAGQSFRTSFKVLHGSALNWYPKHMNSGLKQMQAKLRSIDCVIELHDARIPFSGRNPSLFQQMVGYKPHILILNKSDLIKSKERSRIIDLLENQPTYMENNATLFTNSKNDKCQGIRDLVPKMCELISKSDRFHRNIAKEYNALIIGVPNVGKSSIINILRSRHLKKGRAVKVGPSAGVTKMVHQRVKICESPKIFLYDTPGILQPRIPNPNIGMKLAACANLPDTQVGLINIADFILFQMNRKGHFKYVKFVGLEEPTDCIATVLSSLARKLNFVVRINSVVPAIGYVNKPDLEQTAVNFVHAFRNGELGKFVLDDIGNVEEVERIIEEHSEVIDPELRLETPMPDDTIIEDSPTEATEDSEDIPGNMQSEPNEVENRPRIIF